MAKVTSLYETRDCFRNFLELPTDKLTFEQWNELPHEYKAAALYLRFFNQIVLAWDKANTLDFIDCEEGVEIVNQYLEKNVSTIEANPERFTESYIYKVAFNCMYCICHDRKCDKDRLANETFAIIEKDGEEFNITEFASTGATAADTYEQDTFEKEFWRCIEDVGLEAEKLMRFLLSNNEADLRKMSKRNKNYNLDPLRDVEVHLEDAEKILIKVREKLEAAPANSILGQKLLSLNISFS